jgi:DNA-directed RNA polymerase beta' subunit
MVEPEPGGVITASIASMNQDRPCTACGLRSGNCKGSTGALA